MNQVENSHYRNVPHDSSDNALHEVEERTQSRFQRDEKTNESEAVLDHDLPGEITFAKRSIPKQRTQSIQSVLSSVSLKSLAHSHQLNSSQNKKPFIPQQQNSQSHFINIKTHIQAPATAASSKRRASFEIGQRLPFNKEDAVESDGDVETSEEQSKLTEDALRRLSSFSKFIPAKVDLSMSSKSTSNLISEVNPSKSHQKNSSQAVPHENADSNSPEFKRYNGIINNVHGVPMRPSTSTPSLARRPSTNPSSASKIRGELPKLLSTTTSSQNLTTTAPYHGSRLNLQQSSLPQQRQEQQLLPFKTKHNEQIAHKARENPQSDQPSPDGKLTPTQSIASSQDERQNSPKSNNNANLQTLSDPRRPMYVPAVLRQSSTNLKPEDIRHINELNSKKGKGLLTDAASSIRSQTSHWKLSLGDYNSNRTFPTRAHWRRDTSRASCAYCDKEFTFFERRHHCRRCGDIFCAEHTSHLLKLGSDAQFTIGGSGVLCKVCDGCCKDYELFVKRKFGESRSITGKKENISGPSDRKKSLAENSTQGNIAVPADWSWSSF